MSTESGYIISKTNNKKIEDNFSYHKPNNEQISKYSNIRDCAKKLAYEIEKTVPAGREKALAMTKLEECSMWSNAGIAREQE